MAIEFFIARRHLFSHKKVGFISFISVLSIAGIAIGVASLILTLSIMEGFESEIKEKIIGFDSHIRIRQYHFRPMENYRAVSDLIESVDGVKESFPYIFREALIRSRSNLDGIIIEGVMENDRTFLNQLEHFSSDKLESFSIVENGLSPLVLGTKLASKLEVEKGDSVTLMVYEGLTGPFNIPFVRRFKIAGLFQTGMAEFDGVFAYMPLEAAQSLFRMSSSVTGIKIFVTNFEDAASTSAVIEEKLGGYPFFPLTWKQRHSNLFKWIDTQRMPMLLVFGLIAIVAIFNITSTLVMIVIDKSHEIGVLRAMGFKTLKIINIFLIEGGIIGVAGTLIGMIIAYGLGVLQQTEKFISLPTDVYFMDALPVLMHPKYFIITGAAALFLCLTATLYPALKASKLMPAVALRDE